MILSYSGFARRECRIIWEADLWDGSEDILCNYRFGAASPSICSGRSLISRSSSTAGGGVFGVVRSKERAPLRSGASGRRGNNDELSILRNAPLPLTEQKSMSPK